MTTGRSWQRVVLLLPELDRGGPTLGAVALARAFNGSSTEVVMYVIGSRTSASHAMLELLEPSIAVTFFESSGWRNLPRAYAQLRQALAHDKIDVLMSFGLRPDILNRCVRRRVMSVSSVRALLKPEYVYRCGHMFGALWSRFHHRVLCGLSGVTVMTEAMREALLQGGVSEEAIFRIDNALDVAVVQHASGAQTMYTADCEPGAFHIGVVGSLIPRKRVADVVDAVARLHAELQLPVYLHIFGDGPERTALEQRAKRHRMEGRVRFHGFCDDVLGALSHMSVCVLASGAEGMPRAILEAMALGRTCVVADYPGARDLIADGKTGVLFPVRDVSALAHALQNIMAHGTLPQGPIRDAIKERFDASVVSCATRDMIDELWKRNAS